MKIRLFIFIALIPMNLHTSHPGDRQAVYQPQQRITYATHTLAPQSAFLSRSDDQPRQHNSLAWGKKLCTFLYVLNKAYMQSRS